MELSSCYFCGTALDAPVSAHALGAEGGDPTVSLCPTCQRKLATVLDAVADAEATADALDAAEEQPAEPTPADAEEVSTDDGDEAVNEAEAEDDTTDEGDTATEAAALGGDTNLLHDVGGSEPEDDGDDAAESTAENDAGTGDADPAAETDVPTDMAAGSGKWRDDATSGHEAAPGDGDDSADTDGTETTEADASAEEVDSTETDAAANDSGPATDEPSALSTPTAKKVIRLLQNREFPVEREEFEVVAASAYDLKPGECAEAIDALVAEGYVAEDGGRLVEPA